MILDTSATAVPSAPAAHRQDILAALLQDAGWVAAEFAAIMNASGFGDRVVAGTFPDPPRERGRRVPDENPRWHRPSRFPALRAAPRTRSPPGGDDASALPRSHAGGLRGRADENPSRQKGEDDDGGS